jgi:hypothetical protein
MIDSTGSSIDEKISNFQNQFEATIKTFFLNFLHYLTSVYAAEANNKAGKPY